MGINGQTGISQRGPMACHMVHRYPKTLQKLSTPNCSMQNHIFDFFWPFLIDFDPRNKLTLARTVPYGAVYSIHIQRCPKSYLHQSCSMQHHIFAAFFTIFDLFWPQKQPYNKINGPIRCHMVDSYTNEPKILFTSKCVKVLQSAPPGKASILTLWP